MNKQYQTENKVEWEVILYPIYNGYVETKNEVKHNVYYKGVEDYLTQLGIRVDKIKTRVPIKLTVKFEEMEELK